MKARISLTGITSLRLSAVVVVALLLMAALFQYSLAQSRAALEREAGLRAVASMRIAVARLSGAINATYIWFDELERLIEPRELAAQGMPDEGRLQALDHWIDDIKRKNPLIGNLGYLDSQGRAYLLRGPRRSNVNLADTDYWQELQRKGADGRGRVVVSTVYRFKTTGRFGIVLARGIYGAEGELVGAIVLGLHLEYLDETLDGLDQGQFGTVVLTDDRLRLIVRRPAVPPERRIQFTMPSDPGPVAGTYRARSEIDGRWRVVAIERLERAPFAVAVNLAEDDFLASWRLHRQNLLLAAAALAVAVASAGWWAYRYEQTRASLARGAQLFRTALAMSPAAALHASGPGLHLAEINELALKLLALRRDAVGSITVDKLFVSADALGAMVDEADRAGTTAAQDVQLRRGDGVFWASVQIRCVPDTVSGRNDYLVTLSDIEERRLREEQLRQAATSDPLTGLANRREFHDYADRMLQHCRRHQLPAAVLMLDIDHFKSINDAHGHATGDEVLRRVGAALSAQLRRPDLAARVGGEEFACLLPGADRQAAGVAATRILETIRGLRIQSDVGGSVRVTVSIGIGLWSDGEAGAAGALARADAALYAAKSSGRDQVQPPWA